MSSEQAVVRRIAIQILFVICSAYSNSTVIGQSFVELPNANLEHALSGYSQKLYAILERPDEVNDIQFRRLLVQIEIRLRRAGFHVKSGTMAEYNEFANALARRMKAAKDQADFKEIVARDTYMPLIVALRVSKSESHGFLYFVRVSAISSVWVSVADGPIDLVGRAGSNGSDFVHIGKAKLLESVTLFSTGGVFGLSFDWTVIVGEIVNEIDQFINEWLAANPK